MDCRSLALLIAIVAGLALVPFAGAATIYTIQDLGSLGGQASAAALNNSNLAVGYSTDGTGAQYAVSFTNGTVNSLGGGQANAVNDSGAIAGTVWAGGHAQATRWANGQQQALTGLGGADSYGMGINASGQIAGSASLANGAAHAAVWSGGLVTDLGTLGGTGARRMLSTDGNRLPEPAKHLTAHLRRSLEQLQARCRRLARWEADRAMAWQLTERARWLGTRKQPRATAMLSAGRKTVYTILGRWAAHKAMPMV